jgi:hypothetical protein
MNLNSIDSLNRLILHKHVVDQDEHMCVLKNDLF